MALVAGVEPVPCLAVEAAPVVLLVTSELVVREVLVADTPVRAVPDATRLPFTPDAVLPGAVYEPVRLPFADETFVLFRFPALTEFVPPVALAVECPLRAP